MLKDWEDFGPGRSGTHRLFTSLQKILRRCAKKTSLCGQTCPAVQKEQNTRCCGICERGIPRRLEVVLIDFLESAQPCLGQYSFLKKTQHSCGNVPHSRGVTMGRGGGGHGGKRHMCRNRHAKCDLSRTPRIEALSVFLDTAPRSLTLNAPMTLCPNLQFNPRLLGL